MRSVDNVTAFTAGGDMTKAVYDSGNIAQQLVGTTAVQSITNKTFDETNTYGLNVPSTKINTAAFSVTSSTAPVNITGLTWTVGVGTYSVDLGGYITCNTAGGFNLRGAFSGTASGKMYRAIATDTGGVVMNWPTTTAPFTSFGTTGVTQVSVTGTMTFVVTVAGTFTMQLSQAVSNAAATAIADGQFSTTLKKVS